MDFSAWFEVYLSGSWYTFDARHNTPRIGRILVGRGRDAADVPLSNSFGHTTLTKFLVYTDEVVLTVEVAAGCNSACPSECRLSEALIRA